MATDEEVRNKIIEDFNASMLARGVYGGLSPEEALEAEVAELKARVIELEKQKGI